MSHAESSAELWAERIRSVSSVYLRAEQLLELMGPTEGVPDAIVEARAQKATLLWIKRRLDTHPWVARSFHEKTGIGWLDKLLTAARLKELASVKIVKVGRSSGLRYQIGDLANTFYGRKILDGLGFSRRRSSVDKEEFIQIVRALARIKLRLPQTVEPTTTERFFQGDLDKGKTA